MHVGRIHHRKCECDTHDTRLYALGRQPHRLLDSLVYANPAESDKSAVAVGHQPLLTGREVSEVLRGEVGLVRSRRSALRNQSQNLAHDLEEAWLVDAQ